MTGTARSSLSRRVLIALGMVALAAGSAATTTSLVRVPAQHGGVATDTSGLPAPTNAPLFPGVLPPAAAVTVSTGSCVRVPILVYHYIRVDRNPRDTLGQQLSVTPTAFRRQMDWLRAVGAHPVSLAQIMAALRGQRALPSRPVVLTFDDGYADFATAAVPVLLHDGFIGTDFVVGGFLGRPSYMTAAQVRAVAALGMVVGAHTMHHVDLNALSPQLAQIEIDTSKATLQDLIDRTVTDFAYPYGDYDAVDAALVSQAGFDDAVTMDFGSEQCLTQRFVLRRIRVVGADSLQTFAGKAGVPAPPSWWVD